MDLYDTYGSLHYSLGEFNFPKSTNKIRFFEEISTSEKILFQFNERSKI